MMKLNGRITISRVISNQEISDTINIKFIDENSGSHFMEVTMTPETLALALTGLGHLPCNIELRGLDVLGKTRDMKYEKVIVHSAHASYEEIMEAAKELEVDGWKCGLQETTQRKVSDRNGEYSIVVHFWRYVDGT